MPQLKISKREAIMLSILFFFTAVYLYVNFLLVPQYNRIDALQKEIDKKKNVAVELKNKKEQLKNINKEMDSIKSDIALAEKQMPYSKRIPEMLVNLDEKVSEYKLDLLSIAFDDSAQKDTVGLKDAVDEAIRNANVQKEPDSKKNEDYIEIPIGLSFEGKYDDVFSFIKYLENADRKYIIDSFKLEPVTRNTPMTVSVAFKTFTLKDAGSIHEEPVDYPFLRGKLGKDYPFFDNQIPQPPEAFDVPQVDNGSGMIPDITGQPGENNGSNTENTDTGTGN